MGITTENLIVKYGEKFALKNANFTVNDGEVVTIIGPNGSGKTTLIKAITRCVKIDAGKILLNNKSLQAIHTKKIAQEVAILPQKKTITGDIRVETLVSYGRYPHMKFGKRLKKEDWDIVDWALEKTGLMHLRYRYVETLSGGEQQRAWIAMALAQRSKILVLDEPTTFLDVSFQVEVMELIKELNETLKITVVMVLHDLNHAARYSDKLYVVKDGEILVQGAPRDILQSPLLQKVFHIDSEIYEDIRGDSPFFIPYKLENREE